MNFILLTQESGILGPFAKILGLILDGIYYVLSFVGIENIAICIIILTFIVRMCMFPMTLKQQKFSKLNSVMSPEIKAIQKKYEGKKDEKSQMAMNQEVQAVYEKYGVSPMGSCLQLIIQMPILFALYRVMYNIPAYVTPVKDQYKAIINNLSASQITQYFKDLDIKDAAKLTSDEINNIIDVMSNYRGAKVTDFDLANMVSTIGNDVITQAYDKIHKINDFLIFNLNDSPSSMWKTIGWVALVIPILAGVFQYISVLLSTHMNSAPSNDENNAMMGSLKAMNLFMPLMSVWLCWTFPTGLGLYWIAGSVFMVLQQIFIYFYFKRVSIDDIIKENQEKAKKKKEKRGIYENMISQAANTNTKSLSDKTHVNIDESKLQKLSDDVQVKKKGSIASKADLVKDFNEKNKK